jgi:hypothetical protein
MMSTSSERFDLLLEDLTRIRVIGGVAGDPTPGDRLL